MAYDQRLGDRVRDMLTAQSAISEKRMFGGLAFLVDGRMFAGVIGEDLMLRVGAAQEADALSKPHVRPMDFTGRPMAGYVYVGPEGVDFDEDLERWLQTALTFARTLAPAGTPARRPSRPT